MTLGGVVLAGGRSSRMGTDKALLDWHGAPLIDHITRAVAAATGGPVVVVAAEGQRLPDGLTIIYDEEPDRGPLLGLAAGLAAVEAERAFVCGTDQPDAHRVIPALLAVRAAGVVAYAGQPLGAIYPTSLSELARSGTVRANSLRGLIAMTDAVELDGPAPAALRSLDTPAAYAAALRSSAG